MSDGFNESIFPYAQDALPGPHSIKTLSSRSVIPNSYVQAFIWVGNCSGTTNPAWNDLTTTQCYTFMDPGSTGISRMYSANVSVPGANFLMYRDDSNCQNGYTFEYPDQGGECFQSPDGRGWMSFAVQLEETAASSVSSVQPATSTLAYSTTSTSPATADPTVSSPAISQVYTQTGVNYVRSVFTDVQSFLVRLLG